MSLNIGKMRHRIKVLQLKNSENEVGEIVKDWTELKKLWAEKKQLKGENPTYQDREGVKYTYRFKVRYTPDIDEDMRIIYDNIIYDIKHINHIKELSPYTTIDCVVHKEGVSNE
jgi:SPP1 family predicted phage head-tail adaptor